MLKIFILIGLLLAESKMPTQPPEIQWAEWKTETFKTDLSSPTSFLNAYALKQTPKGGKLFLVVGRGPKDTFWVEKQPKKYDGIAEHLGDKIRIQVGGKTLGYVSLEKDKRRKSFQLPNGIHSEVVYGRRHQKMWAYLYNPEQIKSFSGFRFYPYNSKAVVDGVFKTQKIRKVGYRTTQGDPAEVNQVGNVSFVFNGKEFYLPAYSWGERPEKTSRVGLIFTDLTAGRDTYKGGREVMVELPEGLKDNQTVKIDFNKTLNFYCAHSPFWHCPVGLQSKLDTNIAAGEMLPLRKIVPGT